ncbi:MAG TPA: pyridoxal phosphate-dependent aminotransferase family protein [Ignavibacteriaceae bacterium]|nr:pyridoxal phosphate-dependent aminotransferase family protein [Ignavibacteriaceae bacterium]
MEIFEKCYKFYNDNNFARSLGYPANPRMAKALGLYPFFIPLENNEGNEITIDGKKFIMIGSNNYLGLTNHPKVKEAAIKAIEKYGSACTGSRFLNGTLDLHIELEEKLSKFVGKESALVFSTGYQTNLGTVTSLVKKDDVVIMDKEVHASIIDAVYLAKSNKHINPRFYKHNNMDELELILCGCPRQQPKILIVDGIFSMSGDIAPLAIITSLCKKYNCRIMVDDAHSIGVLGKGRGTAAHFGCNDDVDLIMGTFSKALASLGGFIAGKKEVIHWIQHVARSFIFSASLPPSNLASVMAALEVIEDEPERVERVNVISAYVRNELRDAGYNIGNSKTPIVPIIIGDQFKAIQAWELLFRNNIYTNVAIPPAVSPSKSLLRTSYIATHTDAQIDKVLTLFKKLKQNIFRTKETEMPVNGQHI